MDELYSFPTFEAMCPNEERKLKKVREYLRYQYRTIFCYQQCKYFINFFRLSNQWKHLFLHKPYRANTLLEKYCDARFGRQERLNAILNNFKLIERYFPVALCSILSKEKEIELLCLNDELRLCLSVNQIDPLEGFWAISLKEQQQNMICQATFSFIEPDGLLISSVQGSNHVQALQMMRQTTKKLHGMRPMFMLLAVFKLLSQHLNIKLFGIPHKYQVKYRWNDRSKLLFNYDDFWTENLAIRQKQYWAIPNQINLKPLTEIASNKRSMYRKRYKMFDELEANLRQIFA
ncbi:VirK/YbjX family protein [Actinobacillus vicugnae]|uniref:VirK/YbjX family protein n=1 Tax=Actinobacillus vicugnae TaxID=2573093 RepID=UPI00124081E3|nr:DUF535 family protein [Actinobacillus vicugnae]